MSRIRELLIDPKSVLVFDVDGVLAAYEYGAHNHNACTDEEWMKYMCSHKPYRHARPLKTIQNFLKYLKNNGHDMNRIFVCTQCFGEEELNEKKYFVVNNYPIHIANIYKVESEEEKLTALNFIHDSIFPDVPDENIIMIDDTAAVLTHIQNNSGYSTVHISTFME